MVAIKQEKQKEKRLLLIDANSLIHRAFHALPSSLTTSTGEMVNAVYGFCLAFFKAVKEFQPDYIAAAFDVAGPTFRDKKFKAYKAKREKAPDELYNQMPLVKKVLAVFHVPVYEKEGFEADDIIGTIALQASRKQVKPPLQTIILSGDADVFQLVDKHTKAYTLRKGIQDSVLYDEKAVEKRFGGLHPVQLVDYKALRGDPSDNIPGVTGIGEKTAIDLLLKFQSLENIYKELQEKTDKAKQIKPRIAGLLAQYKEQAFLSKELATLDQQVPIEFQLEDFAWQGFSKEKAKDMLESLEFRTLIPKLQELQGTSRSRAPAPEENMQERIRRLFKEEVFSKTIYELEKRVIPVIAAMEKKGIKIDPAYFTSLTKDMTREMQALERKIFEHAGVVFNINSPQQLSDVLFQTLSLGKKGIRKTSGGVLSTASSELEKLRSLHPVIEEVLSFRELAKLLNTYLEPIPLLADNFLRIHAHFDQLGAATGRLSSSNPNMQNIPIQGEWGKKVRKGFVSETGWKFLSFDYSQMELRIAAFMAQEPKMQQVFLDNGDIHQMTAAEVFRVSRHEVTYEMRYKAKALNFGVLYGMGARGFAQSAGIPFEEAQSFIDDYFVRFPKIAEYIERTKKSAQDKGYVETAFGRKRYVPDIHSTTPYIRAAAERIAVNHPIQGTGADIIKMAMADTFEQFQGESCAMVLQIHDELLFEVADAMIGEVLQPMKRTMETVSSAKIPLVVQARAGTNWAELSLAS